MGPKSQLQIATSSLNRLVKEEKSYHDEFEQQEANIAKLEQGGSNDENAEYTLRQEVIITTILYFMVSTICVVLDLSSVQPYTLLTPQD